MYRRLFHTSHHLVLLQSMIHLYSPVNPLVLDWIMLLVLSMMPYHILSWNIAFTVTILLIKTANDLCIIWLDAPYTTFHKERVVLYRPFLLSKVAFSFAYLGLWLYLSSIQNLTMKSSEYCIPLKFIRYFPFLFQELTFLYGLLSGSGL